MLEKMDEFFNKRIKEYEDHMLHDIESAKEFYPFTAKQLPIGNDIHILDLGCGTGLELGYYFEINPYASITAIDFAEEMLKILRQKYVDKNIKIIQGSYFDVPFGDSCYDAVLSVESLHHFSKNEKIALYSKVHKALKKKGVFLITDYFALTNEEEISYRQEFARLIEKEKLSEHVLYHFDTPFTVEHEIEVLKIAGFTKIEILGQWSATCTIRAYKG